MAKKSKGKAAIRDDLPEATEPVAAVDETAAAPEPTADLVQVNRSNLLELKRAADDYIKEFFSKTYKRSHRHEDVHLLLGWTAALAAFAMSLYGWYVPFKECKPWIVLGTVISFASSALLWLWTKFVVKDIVFEGKRKTFSNRIETETLTIHTTLIRQPEANPPLRITLQYAQSTNGGKSLIQTSETTKHISFGDVFDSEGYLHSKEFAALLKGLEGDLAK